LGPRRTETRAVSVAAQNHQRTLGRRRCYVLPVVAVLATGVGQFAATTGVVAQSLADTRALAELGVADAQYNLAIRYGRGEDVPQDWPESARWLQIAADQNHAPAQSALGLLYREALGVMPDDTVAVEWFRRGAEQGDANGQFLLASMYANGQGVLQDNAEAFMWLQLAADQSRGQLRERYVKSRDEVAAQMTEEQIAEAQRRAGSWIPTPER